MTQIIEIKCKSQDEIVEMLKNQYDLKDEDKYTIIEIKKSKNILGIINISGIYKIEIEKFGKLKEKIITKTKGLLEMIGLELNIEIKKIKEHYVFLNLNGKDNGIIIGKKGKTLNSFEYLLNTIIKGCKIEVDVEGFKEKRINTLRELAKRMAEKALSSNKVIKLNPMPPKERKIIHEIVNQYEELDTYSEGKDPKRYIVIKRKRVG